MSLTEILLETWQVGRFQWADNRGKISLQQLEAGVKMRVPVCLCFLLQLDAILNKHTCMSQVLT